MAKPAKPTDKEYEQLGRAIEQILIKDYIEILGNTTQQIWSALIRGVFIGFGSVLGATLLVGFLIWILGFFNGIPVVGDYINQLIGTLNK